MSLTPVSPIFLLDGGDVSALPLEDMCVWLEAWIDEEPVEFFDARARRLRLVVEGRVEKRRFVDVDSRRIMGFEVDDEQPDEARLKAALVAYLHRTGRPVPDHTDIETFAVAAASTMNEPKTKSRWWRR